MQSDRSDKPKRRRGQNHDHRQSRHLLIDADAQGSLTLSLGYPKPDELPVTLADVMQNVIDDTPMPDSYGILHHGEGVDLLPANIDLSGMEIRLINAMSRESVLRTYINAVKPHYDYGARGRPLRPAPICRKGGSCEEIQHYLRRPALAVQGLF